MRFFWLIGIEDKIALSVVTVLLLSYIAVAYVAAKRPIGISKIKLAKGSGTTRDLSKFGMSGVRQEWDIWKRRKVGEGGI